MKRYYVIKPDPDCYEYLNPLTDQPWKFALFHRRYKVENTEGLSMDAAQSLERGTGYVVVPVYAYDHSRLTVFISDSPARSYDSGKLGFAYISEYVLEREYGSMAQAIEALNALLVEYTAYINGEVWMYEIVEEQVCNLGHTHSEAIDGCGGFLDRDECERQAKGALK